MPNYGNNDYLVTLTSQSKLLEKAHEDRNAGRPVNYWGKPEDLPEGPIKRVVTVTNCIGERWDMKDEYQRRDFTLDQIFFCGQNDHQPCEGCISVSVGDIIHLAEGEDYRVENLGFSRIHEDTTENGEDTSTFFSDGVWS